MCFHVNKQRSYVMKNPWLAIMLLACDIHTNPGPRQNYSCTVCHENVKSNDPSVSCDIKYYAKDGPIRCVSGYPQMNIVNSVEKIHSPSSVHDAH